MVRSDVVVEAVILRFHDACFVTQVDEWDRIIMTDDDSSGTPTTHATALCVFRDCVSISCSLDGVDTSDDEHVEFACVTH